MNPQMKIQQDASGAIATFTGELTIRSAKQLHSDFKKIEKLEKEVRIVLENPSGIDLCFLQLINAYRKTCDASGKKFSLSATLNEGDQQFLSRTGLSLLINNNPL